jgi:hypothetical protein
VHHDQVWHSRTPLRLVQQQVIGRKVSAMRRIYSVFCESFELYSRINKSLVHATSELKERSLNCILGSSKAKCICCSIVSYYYYQWVRSVQCRSTMVQAKNCPMTRLPKARILSARNGAKSYSSHSGRDLLSACLLRLTVRCSSGRNSPTRRTTS